MLEKQTITIADDKTIWDDLGVTSLLRNMRRRKWLIVIVPALWLILSNLAFLLIEKEYSAELLVVPASISGDNGRSGGAGFSSMLGGFGLDLGGAAQDQNFEVYLETWTSSWFAQQLLQNPDLTHRIFASQWSEETHSWIPPHGPVVAAGDAIRRIFGAAPSPSKPPDAEAMLKFLNTHLAETKGRTSVTTQITMELKDRALAEDILNFGHKSINSHLATLFRARADANIRYILEELNRVSVAEYRQALLQTLGQVERMRMLAFSNPEFAAISLTTYATSRPVRPAPVQVILISLMLSVIIYLVIVGLGDRLNLPYNAADALYGVGTLIKRPRHS